jgi:hypothetical protein
MTRCGLPHSDIFGSKLVCSSPKLFAACHVLHRLLAPRHSPYTLSSLTIRNSKLTLTNCLHISWSATVPCNTACVVVGKNYRVQNIQLSKISLAGHAGKLDISDRDRGTNSRARQSRPIQRSKSHGRSGGEYRARTGDLLVAHQALSQLS